MLRAMLGIGGVSLIAFGVFGGQTLESMHRGISGIFTPDTVVVEAVLPLGDVVSEPTASVIENVAEVIVMPVAEPNSDNSVVVLASSEDQSDQLLKPSLSENETVLEVQTASREASTPKVVAAVLEEKVALVATDIAADTLEVASKAVAKSPDYPVVVNSKDEGVEIVLASTVGVPPNDTLFVLKERVNMREGPSTKHPVVLQLDVGQELMEFKRDGRWVHVGAYGTSGQIGWVHNTLVGTN